MHRIYSAKSCHDRCAYVLLPRDEGQPREPGNGLFLDVFLDGSICIHLCLNNMHRIESGFSHLSRFSSLSILSRKARF